MDTLKLKNIVEAALLASGGPLTIAQMQALFGDNDAPERKEIKDAIAELQDDYAERGVEVVEVASGYRVQVRETMAQWLTKLWEERPPRYSRALMETLAIVAYRQPVTRGDIEDIRGVGVTTNIIRTLLERNWIKVVGHRDVPGKPAMFGSTREFLDYFSLKKLDDLPPLAELAELEPIGVQLELGGPAAAAAEGEQLAGDGEASETGEGGERPGDEPDAVNAAGDNEAAESDAGADENLDDIDDFDTADDAESGPVAEAADGLQSLAGESDADAGIDGDAEDDVATADSDENDESQRMTAELDDDGSDDYDEDTDLPPGAVEPLVGLRKPGEEPPEPATISSLDDARAAAEEQGHQSETDFHEEPAEVVPLKTS
jgi:segregation and condensation protein B